MYFKWPHKSQAELRFLHDRKFAQKQGDPGDDNKYPQITIKSHFKSNLTVWKNA